MPESKTLSFSQTKIMNYSPGSASAPIRIGAAVDRTLSNTAFYRGVWFLSRKIAGFPKLFYQKNGRQITQIDYYAQDLIAHYPNELVTGIYLWEMAIAHALVYGNGYVGIERSTTGKALSFFNLHALCVQPFRQDERQWYKYRAPESGEVKTLNSDDVIHIRNLSLDGEVGVSTIDLFADCLNIPRFMARFMSSYFEQGAAVNLAVELDGASTAEDLAEAQRDLDANYSGMDNANKVLVVGNATVKSLTSPLKDFAFDIINEVALSDVARILGVPPHILYDLRDANNNTLEQQGTEVVSHTIVDWAQIIEAEINRKVLTAAERKSGFYFKIDLDELQRGDYDTRVASNIKLYQAGIITKNHVAGELGLPTDEINGDKYLRPLNLAYEQTKLDERGDLTAASSPLDGQAITGALAIVTQLRAGVLTPEAALTLLIAVGIPEDAANVMVSSLAELPVQASEPQSTPQTLPPALEIAPEGNQTPANDPQSDASPPEIELVEQAKRTIGETFGRFIEDAAKRVLTKQAKAFADAERKQPEAYATWLTNFSERQGDFLAEALNPFLSTVIEDKGELAICLQTTAERYTKAVQTQGKEANPQTVIDKLLERIDKE